MSRPCMTSGAWRKYIHIKTLRESAIIFFQEYIPCNLRFCRFLRNDIFNTWILILFSDCSQKCCDKYVSFSETLGKTIFSFEKQYVYLIKLRKKYTIIISEKKRILWNQTSTVRRCWFNAAWNTANAIYVLTFKYSWTQGKAVTRDFTWGPRGNRQ